MRGDITIVDGGVVQGTFDHDPVLMMSETPAIDKFRIPSENPMEAWAKSGHLVWPGPYKRSIYGYGKTVASSSIGEVSIRMSEAKIVKYGVFVGETVWKNITT